MINRLQLKLLLLILVTCLICFISLMIGFSYYSVTSVIACLVHQQNIFAITDIRMPRLIMGALCGSMFALSSNLLQNVFRNPMASSETLGVNAASALCVLIGVSLFGENGYVGVLSYSILGALLGFLATLFASRINGRILHIRLIVIGIALGTLFKAASQFVLVQQDEELASYISFLNGTLYNATWKEVQQIVYPACIFILISFSIIRQLDMLLLSEEAAASIGFKVTKWKIIIIAIALSLAAIAVSGTGSLGFIGLISPNISRMLFGSSNKYNLVGTSLTGIILTILSDILGRIILIPFEVPSGLISIIIGVPYFLYIMRNMRYSA